MPALAMIGAMLTLSCARTMTMTTARIMPVEMLLSSEPIVCARCLRRSLLPGRRSDRKSPALELAMTLGRVLLLARATNRSIERLTNQRNSSPTKMIRRIVPGVATNQSRAVSLGMSQFDVEVRHSSSLRVTMIAP